MERQTQFHLYKMNLGINDFTYNSQFQKVYKKTEMNIPEDIIESIKGLRCRDVLSSSYIEKCRIAPNYLDSFLFDEDECYYKFHFEFDTFFYYSIISKWRKELESFVKLIETVWHRFRDDNGFHNISVDTYKKFYNNLESENPIKLAIDNLLLILPFTIYTTDDLILKIDVSKMKKLLKEAKEYLKK